ncbi:putative head fiber protein [Rhizobium phage RHph_Y52]|nr:putative head fiber protein [Rhizobium phage RHph_Y60]QIG75298.1 putative head fiber protein [Rhizobium phage RHph_Y21]QIG76770.1 putative head fiber protein [Rhizobium phage RHph_Y52]
MGVNKSKRAIMAPGFKNADGSDAIPLATTAVAGLVKKGVAVANAAGANPTAAEYLALLTSLRNAGIIS